MVIHRSPERSGDSTTCKICSSSVTPMDVGCANCNARVHVACCNEVEWNKIKLYVCKECASLEPQELNKQLAISMSENNAASVDVLRQGQRESGDSKPDKKISKQSTALSQTSHKSRVSNYSNNSERKQIILKALERSQRERELVQKEREILERENRLLEELSSINGDDDRVSHKSRNTRAGFNVQVSHHANSNHTLLGGEVPRQNMSPLEPIRAPVEPVNPRPNNSRNSFGPSASQLAARHALGKDLPKFSGKPSEWPAFNTSFRESTLACGFTNNENLYRLQKCLVDPARKMVQGFLHKAEYVPVIVETLKSLYGRPELVADVMMAKLREYPMPKGERLDTVVSFAVEVHNLGLTLEDEDLEDHRRNPLLLKELVSKLPSNLKLKWAEHRNTLNDANDVTIFSKWIYDVAMNLCKAMPTLSLPMATDDKGRKGNKETIGYHNDEPENNKKSDVECVFCQKTCKNLEECTSFKETTVTKRRNAVSDLHICYKCLKRHTFKKPCPNPVPCSFKSCDKKHHPLLHNEVAPNKNKKEKESAKPKVKSDTAEKPVTSETVANYTHVCGVQGLRFRYMPIKLKYGRKEIDVFAFLDEGASSTLLLDSVAEELGVKGKKNPLTLAWTDETISRDESNSEEISFFVKPPLQNKKREVKFEVEAKTVSVLHLPYQTLNYEELCNEYEHLEGLPISSYTNVRPTMIIGMDNWHLAIPLERKEGLPKQPMAAKCRLGWTIFARNIKKVPDVTFFHCTKSHVDNNELHNLVKSFYSTESLGVRPSQSALETKDEARANSLMYQTLNYKNGRYEIGLLWKKDDVKLPDSHQMALKRLYSFEGSLKKKPLMLDQMNKLMAEYEEKDYIRKLTPNEQLVSPKRVWYLPLFVVENPNKPNKVRPVWDAAARVQNVSLNSQLLSGPDLTAPLLGVLGRFRQKSVAIVGDIKEMFHRVYVKEEDQHCQRFLWRQGDSSKPPTVYLMNVMTFGATCSPSCAQFVKNSNALLYADTLPVAANSITKNHYVDDWLESFDSEDEALKTAKDVKFIHQKGGFEIRNWRSNSSKVCKALDNTAVDTSNSINLNLEEDEHIEKVLGMWWNPDKDAFTYSLKFNKGNKAVLKGEQVPTKRELLRILMSIYDPLGLIAHFLVQLKILLQDIWRSKIDWDDKILEKQYVKFYEWLTVLSKIEQLFIPRNYFNGITHCDTIQLHTFVDASENAETAVVYIRFTWGSNVRCSLVAAKTRVAPLKLLSIPKLELESAVLGARLAKSMVECHELKIDQQHLWSDSKTVLAWIHSPDPRKYQKFVAFRIAEIQELSNPCNWRHVPTTDNVADDGTKWSKLPQLQSHDRWFIGPEFLYKNEDNWPGEADNESKSEECLEVEFVNFHEESNPVIDINRFSSWRVLRKSMAYIFQFFTLPQREIKGAINVENYTKAENWLIRKAQHSNFSVEIQYLSKGRVESQSVLRRSPIYKLSPYLDKDGILRVKGRIDANLCVTKDCKHPIILPPNSYLTELIVRHYHDRMGHIFHSAVINEIRQKFHIPRMRSYLNKIRQQCQRCKINQPKIHEPEMAALPAARISPYTETFTFVGIDFFGPMYVTVRRSTEKRWGVLFTCLTTRAVHIEIAYGLDADSCVVAIRTFMLFRGQPREIYTDRGTNFIAAEKILREEIRHVNFNKVADQFEMKWHFNPPASPHMGGAWERLVRAVKRALYAVMPSRNPTDPVLRACMAEAVFMVNSRPLTYVPIDCEDAECITPNHFLFQSSSGVKPVGQISDDDKLLRWNYLTAQQFRNRLWKRFIKEYLPDLVRRTKNFEPMQPIQVGDIVIVCDNALPSNTWPKGRITKVYPGKDGQVRVADVKTVTGNYQRPVCKLAKLDVQGTRVSGETPSQARDC